jgi:hypothetical protein
VVIEKLCSNWKGENALGGNVAAGGDMAIFASRLLWRIPIDQYRKCVFRIREQ